MNFRYHVREFIMAKTAQVRFWLPEGSKLEVWLGKKYAEMFEKQFALRRAAGKKEFAPFVIWGNSDD